MKNNNFIILGGVFISSIISISVVVYLIYNFPIIRNNIFFPIILFIVIYLLAFLLLLKFLNENT